MKSWIRIAVGVVSVIFAATVARSAPAPVLTRLDVIGVVSSKSPYYENISQYQMLTSRDHGGPELYIETVEIGYVSSSTVHYNGSLMQEKRAIPLTYSNGVVYGYKRLWYRKGSFTSGTVTCKATSQAFPFRTLTDRLNVR